MEDGILPDRFIQMSDSLLKLLPALALAVLGGLVKLIREGRKTSMGKIIGCLLSAFFAGSLTLLFVQDLPISISCKAGVIGVSGFAAGEYLTVLSDSLIKITRFRFKQINKEDKN